jgi:DNA-binding transcriptional ArsR family regulator
VQIRAEELDRCLMALAHQTRRQIVSQLSRGQMRLTDLAKGYPIALNTVSKHVRVLEQAGLVLRDVRGRNHVLSLNAKRVSAVRRWVDRATDEWSAKLFALEAHLERKRARQER